MNADKMAEWCLILSALLAVIISVMFWGNWLVVVGAWVIAFPFAMFLGLIAGVVGNALGMPLISDDEESSQVWAEETDVLVLERSEALVGKFQDEDIHEWVLLKRPDTGEPIHLVFSRTIDMRGDYEFEPPQEEWFCILPPGIMYVEPEKTEALASE